MVLALEQFNYDLLPPFVRFCKCLMVRNLHFIFEVDFAFKWPRHESILNKIRLDFNSKRMLVVSASEFVNLVYRDLALPNSNLVAQVNKGHRGSHMVVWDGILLALLGFSPTTHTYCRRSSLDI